MPPALTATWRQRRRPPLRCWPLTPWGLPWPGSCTICCCCAIPRPPGRRWTGPRGRSARPRYGYADPLVALSGVPAARALHATHGTPHDVTRATLYDIQRWADHYRRATGRWGIAPNQLAWLCLHLRGGIFQLGRLQFQPGPWDTPARADRHRATGRVIALSEEGVRRQGRWPVRWRRRCERSPGGLHGSSGRGRRRCVGAPILPIGRAERREVRLPLAEWEEALAPGVAVLHLHIPAGVPLDMQECQRSITAALDFSPATIRRRRSPPLPVLPGYWMPNSPTFCRPRPTWCASSASSTYCPCTPMARMPWGASLMSHPPT